eukprot:8573532-Pyramimonas_sp.AAC.1
MRNRHVQSVRSPVRDGSREDARESQGRAQYRTSPQGAAGERCEQVVSIVEVDSSVRRRERGDGNSLTAQSESACRPSQPSSSKGGQENPVRRNFLEHMRDSARLSELIARGIL